MFPPNAKLQKTERANLVSLAAQVGVSPSKGRRR
jgi:hypothetical protein